MKLKDEYSLEEIIEKLSYCESIDSLNIINELIASKVLKFTSYDLFLLSNNESILYYSSNKNKPIDNIFLEKNVFETIIHEFSNSNHFYLIKDSQKNQNQKEYLIDLFGYDKSIFFKIKHRNKDIGFISFSIENELDEITINKLVQQLNIYAVYVQGFINEQFIIKKTKSYDHTNEEFKFLFHITNKLNSFNDYNKAIQYLLEQIAILLNSKNAFYLKIDLNNSSAKILNSLSKKINDNSFKLSEKIVTSLLKNELNVNDITNITNLKLLELKNPIVFPFLIKDFLTGVILIDVIDKEIKEENLNLIKTILNQASITIENINLYNDMQDLVIERTLEISESNEELKRQKEKLELLAKRLQSIIRSIPDGILVLNENNKISNYNKAFERFLFNISEKAEIPYLSGYELPEIKNFIQDEESRKIFDSLIDLILNNEEYFYEVDFDINKKYYYKILCAPIKLLNEHEINKKDKVIVFHNVTKSKELEKMKSDFMAVVSHELKTPVSAMIGFSTLIEDEVVGEVTEGQIDYLHKIQVQGERLIRLINDLLDFSKLESGHMNMYNQILDSGENIYEVVEILRPLVEEKNMKIEVNIQEELPPLNLDPDKFKQILINLIGNAIKFTPENTGLIEVFSEQLDNYILFKVKDNGIGIPKENQKMLFEMFYQADNTSTRKYGGTGLGLAIVKKLLELMNGEIWVESTINIGSTFYFKIPFVNE
ncbi:MAG: ATP-binding protein [Candidatus Sericytochromatia bacterium]